MPRPCRAAKGLEYVFPIWFTQYGRVRFTCHAMLRPCRSSQGHSTARPSRDGRAVLSCGLEKNGMVGAWYGHGKASVNQTGPHCVNQMGKTHSKPLVARHGRSMGTACYVWIGLYHTVSRTTFCSTRFRRWSWCSPLSKVTYSIQSSVWDSQVFILGKPHVYYDFQNCGKFWDDILLPKKVRKTLYGIDMAEVRSCVCWTKSKYDPQESFKLRSEISYTEDK